MGIEIAGSGRTVLSHTLLLSFPSPIRSVCTVCTVPVVCTVVQLYQSDEMPSGLSEPCTCQGPHARTCRRRDTEGYGAGEMLAMLCTYCTVL